MLVIFELQLFYFIVNKRGGDRVKVFCLFLVLLSSALFAQQDMEDNLNTAYQNAKKGVYWALGNIPEKKSGLQIDLIDEGKLYASVKLEKEFNGIKIESTGYFNTTEVSVIVYRSNDGLIKDGYLKLSGDGDKKKED
jgi:hypothetical protein